MTRSRFSATRLTPSQAHELWSRSDEASAFTRPDYLAQLVDEVEWWGVERSGEVVAAWPLVRAVAGGEIGPPPFCYYVGPMFARELREAKYHRYWFVFTTAFSTLVDAITAEHPGFAFSLPLGLTDTRILQWWNFDHPGQPGFTITPRHTARIDLARYREPATLLQSFSHTRRRAMARWSGDPPVFVDNVTTEGLIELDDQALRRSGGDVNERRHSSLRRMAGLANSGAGSVFGFAPHPGADIKAAVVVLDGVYEANFVLGAASEDWRNSGIMAWATWHALLGAQDRGKRWFDCNGANSPRRAADNHHYGAEAMLYFDCTFERH